MALEGKRHEPIEQSQGEAMRSQAAEFPHSGAPGGDPQAIVNGKDAIPARSPLRLQRRQDRPSRKRPIGEPPKERPVQSFAEDRGHGNGSRREGVKRRALSIAMGTLLFIVAASAGYLFWDYARRFESTDDAFVAARVLAIAPKVAGYITAVPVTDNQHVAAGGVIVHIDDRDYRIALDEAQAAVDGAQARIQDIDAQIGVQQEQIVANQAQVDHAKAALVFAEQQNTRFQDLARTGAGTIRDAQQYVSQLHQQQAALRSAQASLLLAQRQIEPLKAQRAISVASLAQAKAQRDQAQLNLSYTTVTAAQDGHIANLSAAVGQLAQPGTNLTMFVPDEIWVTANFKETQLDKMRVGQPVTLSIDAYPERTFHGHVASVQPGSGTAFSLLPAENATGNYVKIVQRVPVKILFDNNPTDVTLGPGMSVVPIVRVDPTRSIYERLEAWL